MNKMIKNILLIFISVASVNAQKILLPIEVLGDEGLVKEQRFTIDAEQYNQISSIDNLWLKINNLSYQGKASIRINEGNWISLNHSTTNIYTPEKERGGMVHGGYNTIRFTVSINNFREGQNIIKFRFNTSDGISNGFRVIDLDLLDVEKNRILKNSPYYVNPNTLGKEPGENYYIEDDPNNWKSPYYDNSTNSEPNALNDSIAKGKNIWFFGRNGSKDIAGDLLWNHNLPEQRKGFWYNYELPQARPIKAKCTNCHTQDGRDLEIFSYSNLSIIERAKFHKLTEEEGKLIAAYIRSLSYEHDNVGRYGRPWNPPYQPGPELENKPVSAWVAGAGLDAVLEKDEDMLYYMFENGINQDEVDSFFDSDKTFETYTLPMPIQFPDWKHWLPLIHPMDAYDKGTFYEDTYNDRSPFVNIRSSTLNLKRV